MARAFLAYLVLLIFWRTALGCTFGTTCDACTAQAGCVYISFDDETNGCLHDERLFSSGKHIVLAIGMPLDCPVSSTTARPSTFAPVVVPPKRVMKAKHNVQPMSPEVPGSFTNSVWFWICAVTVVLTTLAGLMAAVVKLVGFAIKLRRKIKKRGSQHKKAKTVPDLIDL